MDMDKNFDPKTAEAVIRAQWHDANAFAAGVHVQTPNNDQSFCIIMPRPMLRVFCTWDTPLIPPCKTF